MNSEQWQRAWRIFNAARELPPDQQRLFVESECADPEIVEHVLAELEALPEAEDSSPDAAPPDRAGALVGRYQVAGLLGRGGMGEVYAARDTELNRPVALKFLLPQSLGDSTAVKRFVREAKAASALNHPNILTIHEVLDSSSGLAIAMELVEGEPLSVLRGSVLAWRQAVEIGRQAAAALAAAHARSIVHRDIKPENLMLRPDGIVKVLDFGLAQSFGGEGASPFQSSRTGLPGGTLRYMSPEQLRNEPVTGASDVYSLGLVLYELIAGSHPFESSYAWETAHAIHTRDPQPLASANRETPEWLNELIGAMLNRDAALRPAACDVESALSRDWRDSGSARVHKRLWKPAAAAVIVAGAATLVWSMFHLLPLSKMSAVAFTEYPGDEDMPSFSPDGQSVAFAWDGPAQDNFDIYVRAIGSTSLRRVTSSPLQDYSPAWSPDGRSIAFLRKPPDSGSAVLLMVPATGGPEREIASLSLNLLYPRASLSWTPDGQWLVAPGRESEREPEGLFLISTKDGTKRRLTRPSPEQTDIEPAISPDGRTLAFMRSHSEGVHSIYVLPLTATYLSAGEPQPVPAFPNLRLATPQWAADGKELLFVANPQSGMAIWRIRVPEPGKPLQPPRRETYAAPGFRINIGPPSVPAHRLIYSTEVQQRSIWLTPLGVPGRTPQQARRIGAVSQNNSGARISPDGSRIVYESIRTGSTEIWSSDLDGTHALQLTNFGGPGTGSSVWSPDGRRIAFDSRIEGRPNIYLMPAAGGRPERLTDALAENYLPAWSKDGRWIYYCSSRSGTVEVWRQPAAGGAAEQLTRHGGWAPTESPDGAALYYQRRVPAGWSLRQLTLATGIDREILPAVMERAFAIAQDGVYYVPLPGPDGRSTIQFQGFESKVSRLVATVSKPMNRALALSPDGSFLLYSQLDRWGQDLMLVENFR